jgi:hypothetical protein
VNTFNNGVLHLEKKCATTVSAAAGADITGFTGQTFASASFTLASAAQCNGGSPRFDIQDAAGKVYFLGCNNVTPVTNANGTVTYNFTMADLLRINPTLGAPGAIKAVDVAVDVQGVADISRILFNGVLQVPAGTGSNGTGPGSKADCKHGGWRTFTNPTFKNQGQCVSYVQHHSNKGNDDNNDESDNKNDKSKNHDDSKKHDSGKHGDNNNNNSHGDQHGHSDHKSGHHG